MLDLKRVVLYLLSLVAFVGCECFECADPGARPEPHPGSPVQPIKRRPIVPDGQLQRPRTIERNIRFIFGCEFSSEPATMQVYTATGDLLFNDVIYPDDIIEISKDVETLIFVVDGERVDLVAERWK